MSEALGWPDQPRMLLSYAYFAQWDVPTFRTHAGADILVDSGAFTAATQGKSVDIAEYTDWLAEREGLINHAASLDVIGDEKASARNHEWQRSRLGDRVDLLATWHLGSSLPELHRLCRENDYLAIGGCVPYAKRPELLMRHLVQAHKIAREHGTRLHGLGITGRTAMFRLPWGSVDSSSWATAHRYGQLNVADRFQKIHSITYGQRQDLQERRLIRAYGGNPTRVEDPGFNLIGKVGKVQGDADRRWSINAAIRSTMSSEPFLRAKHGTDLRIYFAMGPSYVEQFYEAWRAGSPFASRVA
jgi:hypothetical protein